MSKVIIKRIGKPIEVVDYQGKFEDLNRLIKLRDIAFIPFDLGECDISIGLNPLHKTDGSMPNFFVYDRYDIICGNVVIFKCKCEDNNYEVLDLTNKDIKMIDEYMRREEYV